MPQNPVLVVPQSLRPFQPLNAYNFEEELFQGAGLGLEPGMVVLEAGTYCGALTALMAQMVGSNGRVLLFEPDEAAFTRARQLLEANDVNNVVLVDHLRLSETLSQMQLKPGWIKLNFEQLDAAPVLLELGDLLTAHKPLVVMAFKGKSGAAVREGLACLSSAGYALLNLESGLPLEEHAALPVYIFATPFRLGDGILARARQAAAQIARKNRTIEQLTRARTLVNDGRFEAALPLVRDLLAERPLEPEPNYLAAVCLGAEDESAPMALLHYQAALEGGFDAFWVLYNRAGLLRRLGELEAAHRDAEQALALCPGQEGAQQLVTALGHDLALQALQQGRERVAAGNYDQALALLLPCQASLEGNPEAHYLTAFCLQMTGKDSPEAARQYGLALACGFDEFWVRYNRGLLMAEGGHVVAALADLGRAVELEPAHTAAQQRLEELLKTLPAGPFSNINGLQVRVEPPLAGVLPASPCTLRFDYEPLVFCALEALLHEGSTFFDVGSSYGVVSVLAGLIIGDGRVTAFEANGSVLEQARCFVAANGLVRKVRLVHACVGERSATAVDFYEVPGAHDVASTRAADIIEEFPGAQRVSVAALALDDYCEAENCFPDCVKLDIEGSEYLAWQGMQNLLRQHRPHLVIETHHREIEALGGSLSQLCAALEEAGYGLFDLGGGCVTNARAYAGAYAGKIGYLLASDKVKETAFALRLAEKLAALQSALKERELTWAQLAEGRKRVEQGAFKEALELLQNFLKAAPEHAEANYLLAFTLGNLCLDGAAALGHYATALKSGFDAFWVHFNRAALFRQNGDLEAARADARQAVDLQPQHEGAQALLALLTKELAQEYLALSRSLTNRGEYSSALGYLPLCFEVSETCPEAHYLAAVCRQMLNIELKDALRHYQAALEGGFDEFWVCFNRSALAASLEDFGAARRDLRRALELNPGHNEVRQRLEALEQPGSPATVIAERNEGYTARVGELHLFIPPALKPFKPLNHYNFEEELFHGLALVMQAGMTAFEMGSFCGVMTTLMAKMAGAAGQVVLFEASYESYERARVMVEANALNNVTLMNAFVGSRSGEEREFYLVRSGEGWAVSSADPGIRQLYPEAQVLRVPTLSLDDYIERSGVVPQVIKMDIEGAEYLAVQGMAHLLAENPPEIVLEVHGDRMPGIGGDMPSLMEMLESFGYHFLDLQSGMVLGGAEYAARYPIFGHLLCSPRPFSPALQRRAQATVAVLAESGQQVHQQGEARHLLNAGQAAAALAILEPLLARRPQDPDVIYDTAYCLHQLNRDNERALALYSQALHYGFDPFWVRYNRGALLQKLGRSDAARSDLEQAAALNPQHEGPRRLLDALQGLRRMAGRVLRPKSD